MMANILKILHPFIPFFTESVWSKNKYKAVFKDDLVFSSWPNFKKMSKFNKNQNDINNLIELVSNIRSTKAELKIAPKLFCDISFTEKSNKLKKLIKDNIGLIKPIGRINGIKIKRNNDKNSIEILVLKEKISLAFKEEIDLSSQKDRLLQKITGMEKQIESLNNKLKNKAYLKNAPKDLVQNDKKLIRELTVEDEKLRSIVSSIN